MTAKEYDKMSDSEKKKEDWMNNKWRPAMGWTYMATCIFDFVIAPILWSVVQALGNGGRVEVQWQPITLQGAGLYHIAMGAILGIAAYGRTQEKMAGANNGGIALPANVGTTYTPPAPAGQPMTRTAGFGASAPSFGSNSFGSNSFGAPTALAQASDVSTGWGGKAAPPKPDFWPER